MLIFRFLCYRLAARAKIRRNTCRWWIAFSGVRFDADVPIKLDVEREGRDDRTVGTRLGDRELVVPGVVREVHRRREGPPRPLRAGRSRGGGAGRDPAGDR